MKQRDSNNSESLLGQMSETSPDVGNDMSDAPNSHEETVLNRFCALMERFHADESGVAMTEYIIVFTLMSFGATLSLLIVTIFIKGYRDFLVWWLGHPMV